MNIELKPFQDTSVYSLLQAIVHAKQEIADRTPQAIVLSSPTGSGKTIALAALLATNVGRS
jgi:hypothetical protein